jgi:hypothetical protein
MRVDPTLRVIADGLIHRAETLPRRHPAAGQLRDAAAALLDADMALERNPPANEPTPAKDQAA